MPLILTKLPPQHTALYRRLLKLAGSGNRQMLTLTKTEMWDVPKDKVEDIKRAAAQYGLGLNQLGADWNHVFQKIPANVKISAPQMTLIDQAKAFTATSGLNLMTAPTAPIVEYALTKDANDPTANKNPAKIFIRLNDNTILPVVRSKVDIIPSHRCTWQGVVEGTDLPVTIMWWPGGKMTGNLQHNGKIYSIRHMGGELHAVIEMAEERMPQEHGPLPERIRVNDPNSRDDPLITEGDASFGKPKGQNRQSKRQYVPTQGVVIDVIVAYTKKVASNYGDVKRDLVELAIEEGNESFRQSGVENVKLRLVHTYETSYVEEGATHFDHVWRFADKGDGYMDEIHGLRDKYRADVAVLIVDDPKGCGLATRVFADADEAFAVVHHGCAVTTYSLAHEIGHIIGARHELQIDKNFNPFPYGHGFVNGTKWRDIMSYRESCNGCPRLPIWSTPNIAVRGELAGTPNEDNARVIREQAGRVAAFR